MTDFDLSKITGREPPVETDEDMMNALADALGYAEALRTENEALRDHRDQLTEDLGLLEDRMQELLARVASEYRNGHAAGQEAAMESVAALRARVARARSLLLKLCESADHMPDDVAEWLHDESN